MLPPPVALHRHTVVLTRGPELLGLPATFTTAATGNATHFPPSREVRT
jgi:hypothetical protein